MINKDKILSSLDSLASGIYTYYFFLIFVKPKQSLLFSIILQLLYDRYTYNKKTEEDKKDCKFIITQTVLSILGIFFGYYIANQTKTENPNASYIFVVGLLFKQILIRKLFIGLGKHIYQKK